MASVLCFINAIGIAACGDVSIERPPDIDAGPLTARDPLQPVCAAGELRCNGGWVERCSSEDAASAASWELSQNCRSEALCEAGSCKPPVCEPREVRCSGTVPQRCRADLNGWEDLGECISAAHCSTDADACGSEGKEAACCLAAPCDPGELRCNARDMQRCRQDQTDFDPVGQCATPALCTQSLEACSDPATCECLPPTCDAGETRCVDNVLERCNADQTGFEFVETCDNTTLCELGRRRTPLSCEPAACAAGSFACTAAGVLQACNAEQTALDVVRPCPGGAAFCNAGQGQCSDTPCDPGDRACEGPNVVSCRDDQSGFVATGEVCASDALCVSDGGGQAACLPPACAPSDVRCAGSQLQRCNAARTDFGNVGPPCPRDDLCSAARQRCDFCVPSRRECTPDLSSSRTCAADGNSFGPLTFCPLGCIAATGACQTCNIGSYVCQNGLLSRCNDGLSFTPLNRGSDCAGATLVTCNGGVPQNVACGPPGCNAARRACNECSGQARVCEGATSFRACQLDGTFGAPTSCQPGLSCAGQGQCVCTPNQPFCDGDALLVCNAAGNALLPGDRCSANVLRTCSQGLLTIDTCGSAALCEAAAGSQCPACIEGESTCSAQSGQPLDCIGGELIGRGPCPAGTSCQGAGVCRCAEDLRCEGDTLLACDEAGTGFEAAAACAAGTLRTCSDGDVVQTPCADADCLECGVSED